MLSNTKNTFLTHLSITKTWAISLIIIYRLVYTAKHLNTIKDFLIEFRELFSNVMLEKYPFYIVGYFNIHLEGLYNIVSSGSKNGPEKVNYTNKISFLRLLNDKGFCQLAKCLIHNQDPHRRNTVSS